jgi:hypothetical protein
VPTIPETSGSLAKSQAPPNKSDHCTIAKDVIPKGRSSLGHRAGGIDLGHGCAIAHSTNDPGEIGAHRMRRLKDLAHLVEETRRDVLIDRIDGGCASTNEQEAGPTATHASSSNSSLPLVDLRENTGRSEKTYGCVMTGASSTNGTGAPGGMTATLWCAARCTDGIDDIGSLSIKGQTSNRPALHMLFEPAEFESFERGVMRRRVPVTFDDKSTATSLI